MRNLLIGVAIGVVVIVLVILLIRRRRQRPTNVKPEQFAERWQSLQKHCASRKTWPQAIVEADDLLNDALKRSRYKGKTTGERLVSAQRNLTDNENVWFGHKLRTKIAQQDVRTLKKQDILNALGGFRQALRDLGVLR